MTQKLFKHAVTMFCLLGLILIGIIVLVVYDFKKDKEQQDMLSRYQGNSILNGVYLDNNCSPEDIIVIGITEYLHKVCDTGSVLCQVTEPSDDDNYHRYLKSTRENYDGHTYWLYAGRKAGYLFYADYGTLVTIDLSEVVESI